LRVLRDKFLVNAELSATAAVRNKNITEGFAAGEQED